MRIARVLGRAGPPRVASHVYAQQVREEDDARLRTLRLL